MSRGERAGAAVVDVCEAERAGAAVVDVCVRVCMCESVRQWRV